VVRFYDGGEGGVDGQEVLLCVVQDVGCGCYSGEARRVGVALGGEGCA